jgi:antitoxin component YwqK of YwqJK toxin-antitoxin module
MLKLVFASLSCFLLSSAHAQFYYQDIVGVQNTSKNFLRLKANKVKKVEATSIEPDGSETEDFGIKQELNSRRNILITQTRADIAGTSILTTYFNDNGFPVSFSDSSNNTVNDVRYTYDEKGRLQQLSTNSHEPGDTNNYFIKEDHLFYYDGKGQLVNMLKIKNKVDTMLVIFKPSENGPLEEAWYYKGYKQETWYYYYDDKGRLTDIARYNPKAQKTLPDYIFEYDEDGDLSQQTVVMPITNFYRVWVYEYLENGLKKAESILKKGKEQEGRIVYSYDF